MISFVTIDVPYLPKPNRVEIIISDSVCDLSLCRTAFMMPVFDDGSLLLANNQRRGIETPGGHIDRGETAEEAAIREAFEETACIVTDVRPLGFLRMTSDGTPPSDWYYPHPLSYQQFYTGRVAKVLPYNDNAECAQPVRRYNLDGLRPTIQILGERARDIFRR